MPAVSATRPTEPIDVWDRIALGVVLGFMGSPPIALLLILFCIGDLVFCAFRN